MNFKSFKFRAIIFLVVCLSLTGCNYEFRETPKTDGQTNQNAGNQSNQAGSGVIAGNAGNKTAATPSKYETGGAKLVLSETSQTVTIPCEGREVELTEEAVANNYKLTGECKKLTVGGVSNQITVEKVGEIVVAGVSNKVYYGEGLNGKKPKISKSGTSTAVETIKSQEEKQANADK